MIVAITPQTTVEINGQNRICIPIALPKNADHIQAKRTMSNTNPGIACKQVSNFTVSPPQG